MFWVRIWKAGSGCSPSKLEQFHALRSALENRTVEKGEGLASGLMFYGWYVVYAICFVLMMTAGLAFHNLSILLNAFVSERGFPVGLASGATAIYFIAWGLGGAVAGRLMDRKDPRQIMIGAACVRAAALACAGLLRTTFELYAFHIVYGFCYGCCGLVPAMTIVARWFEARRPLAMSIATTGLSLGGIFVTPASAFLISHWGLSGAAPWLGLAMLIGVVPVTAIMIRASPRTIGLEVGGSDTSCNSPPNLLPGVPFALAWRTRFFVGLTIAYIFGLGSQIGAIAHLYRLANTHGSAETAALVVALLASASLVGRLSGGWVLQKFPTRPFTIVMFTMQSVAIVVLSLATSSASIVVGAACLGITVGNMLMLQPLLLAEEFGTREYARIYSVSQLVTALGVAGGPALVGFIEELTGDYSAPYGMAAACSMIGLLILIMAGPVHRPLGQTALEPVAS
jgi:MFS family permease